MKLLRYFSIALLFMYLILTFTDGASASEILPLKYVKPGMKGYGKSVFRGTRIETFPVTVLGIAHKQIGGADMIIIRIDGGYCVEHKIGIIAGMSGSPIYINNKLIGAISYGWAFSKEPIAGVTPIEEMMQDMIGKGKKVSAESDTVHNLQNPIIIRGKKYTKVKLFPNFPLNMKFSEPSSIIMTPVKSLFIVSGFREKSFKKLKNRLGEFDILPVEGTGLGNVPDINPPLVPGASVGVQLLSGDLNISATGTLTYREKDKILAFGHPMLQMGDISFPMVTSYVHNILPSYLRSFKMSSPIKIVGTLTRDRLFGVTGVIHQIPSMIPLTIDISDRTLNKRRSYNLKVVNHPSLAPMLMEESLVEAISSTSAFSGESTASINYMLEVENHPPLEFKDMLYNPAIDFALSKHLDDNLRMFMDNAFQPLKFKRIKIKVEIEQKRNIAILQKISIPNVKFRPGEEVPISIWLKPFGSEPIKQEISLTLPADLIKGEVRIGVAGGVDADVLQKKLLLSSPYPTSVKQIFKFLKEKERNNQVVIKIIYPTMGARINQEKFNFLPQSILDLFATSSSSEIQPDRDASTILIDTPWVVMGDALIGIKVEKGFDLKEKPASMLTGGLQRKDDDGETALEAPMPDNPEEPKEEEKLEAQETGESQPKPPPSGTKKWRLSNPMDFERGKLEGTSYTDKGELILAPVIKEIFNTAEPLIFSLAYDKKRKILYGGLCSSGRIIKIPLPEKKPEYIDTGEILVSALAVDDDGNLWNIS